MSDIVERLRRDYARNRDAQTVDLDAEVLLAAADEIERLRKATGGLDPALVAKALNWLAACLTGAKWDCEALTADDVETIGAATFEVPE